MSHPLTGARQLSRALLLILLACWLPAAMAHSPHDNVFAVQYSPTFSEDHTVFAIVRGSFLKSVDGGASWRRQTRGLDHIDSLRQFAVADDGRHLLLSSLRDGVFISSDAGSSWTRSGNGLEGSIIDLVALAPGNPRSMVAVDIAGDLFASNDGGQNWRGVPTGAEKITAVRFFDAQGSRLLLGSNRGNFLIWDLITDRADRETPIGSLEAITALAHGGGPKDEALVLLGTASGEILSSRDGGHHFERIPAQGKVGPVLALELSPAFSADGRAYASTWEGGPQCSEDFARSWVPCRTGLSTDKQADELGRPSFTQLSLSPAFADDRTLYLGGYDGLFQSRDAGASWQEVPSLSPLTIVGLALSPAYAHDRTMMLSNWMWGAFRSVDGGESWTGSSEGAVDQIRDNGLTRLFQPVFSPGFAEDRTVFTTTWWHLLKSTDGGDNWRKIVPIKDEKWRRTHQGGVIGLSPTFTSDGVMFLGSRQGQVLKSDNHGESFIEVHAVENWVSAIALSPDYARDQTLFMTDTAGIYKSDNGGRDWMYQALIDPQRQLPIRPPVAHPAEHVHAFMEHWDMHIQKESGVRLAISPSYAGDGIGFAGTINGLFRTDDGGASWTLVRGDQLDEHSIIESIAISPEFSRDGFVVVSLRGRGLLGSWDRGESFITLPASPELAAEEFSHFFGMAPKFPTVVFSPNFASDRTLFGFSGPNLYRSEDGGRSWSSMEVPAPSALTRLEVWFHANHQRAKQQLGGGLKVWLAVGSLGLILASGLALALARFRRRSTFGRDLGSQA